MAKGQLDSIQVLRGMAAMSVLFHHAFSSVTIDIPEDIHLRPPLWISTSPLVAMGAVGVDLFFVLSGFLMVYISLPYVKGDKSVGHFLSHRAIRIWPLYALVMALVCLVYLLKKGPSTFDLQPMRLLGFLFIPSFNQAGVIRPILGVGWTLSYEAMFYLVFAATLLLFRGSMLAGLSGLLACLFVVGHLLPATWVAHVFLSDSVLFEFLLGAAIAKAYLSKHLPLPYPWIWITAALVWLAAVGAPKVVDADRLQEQGIAAALAFIGILHLRNDTRWPRWLLKIGTASYSLYLTHTVVISFLILPVARRAFRHWSPPFGVEIIALAAVAASIAAALLCYRFIETPLLAWGHSAYRRWSFSAA